MAHAKVVREKLMHERKEKKEKKSVEGDYGECYNRCTIIIIRKGERDSFLFLLTKQFFLFHFYPKIDKKK